MKYEYRAKETASKLLYVKDLPGLPEDITLSFNILHIRFYKSREMGGFFFCTLAIPTIKDDEGYVFESDFYNSKGSIDFPPYIAPYNDTPIEELPKSVSCYFEDKTERQRRMLFLNMKIKGTPFCGHVFIDSDYYTEK
ncbi:MAG: hypothetical protein ABL885_15340 [Methylophilaceae bacterium]